MVCVNAKYPEDRLNSNPKPCNLSIQVLAGLFPMQSERQKKVT